MPPVAISLAIFVGGGVGALLRFMLSGWVMRRTTGVVSGIHEHQFPWGTLAVNLIGALAIAVLAEMMGTRFDAPYWLRALLITGLLGGFTTFSAFSLETANLWQRGEPLLFMCYIAASVGGTVGIVLAVQKLLRVG